MRPGGVFDERYEQDMAIVRTRFQWIAAIAALVLFLALPLLVSTVLLNLVNLICITAISAVGLGICIGYTGMISLGQAAFMAVGAYTTGILASQFGLPFWLTLPLGAVVASIVGLISGTPSLRLKGFYLAMATLAVQFIIPWLIINVWPEVTGGTSTLVVPAPKLGDITLNSEESMFYLIFPVTALMIFFSVNLIRTRIGRAFIAIRDNDLAAEVMGINVFRYKVISFALSAFYGGVAGSLWAYWMRGINVEQFGLDQSIWYMGMLIVGGMGSNLGAILGVILIRVLDSIVPLLGPLVEASWFGGIPGTSASAMGPIAFGLVLIIFLIFEPRGMAHRWELIKSSVRLWPFSY